MAFLILMKNYFVFEKMNFIFRPKISRFSTLLLTSRKRILKKKDSPIPNFSQIKQHFYNNKPQQTKKQNKKSLFFKKTTTFNKTNSTKNSNF